VYFCPGGELVLPSCSSPRMSSPCMYNLYKNTVTNCLRGVYENLQCANDPQRWGICIHKGRMSISDWPIGPLIISKASRTPIGRGREGRTECGGLPLCGGVASLRLVTATVTDGGAWSHVVRDIKGLGSCVCGEGLAGGGDCDYFCTINRRQKREEEKRKRPRVTDRVLL